MVAAAERGDHDSKPVPVIKLANPAVPAFKNPLRSICLLLYAYVMLIFGLQVAYGPNPVSGQQRWPETTKGSILSWTR
jgi:hypothetical protein